MIDYSNVQLGDILIIRSCKKIGRVINISKYGLLLDVDNYFISTGFDAPYDKMNMSPVAFHGKVGARKLDYLE